MNGNGTLQTADQQRMSGEITAANSCCGQSNCSSVALNNSNCDVTTNTQFGVSSSSSPKTCHCSQSNTTTIISAVRNCQANGNHTTTPPPPLAATATTTNTTTTTIEYELMNGVAKLCKISTSRIAAEKQPLQTLDAHNNTILSLNTINNTVESSVSIKDFTEKENEKALNLPLLTEADLKDLTRNVNAINAFNNNIQHKFLQTSPINLEQRANFTMSCTNNCGSLNKAARDRLGLWGNGDNDVPGSVSGLERLQKKKYNKVIMKFLTYIIFFNPRFFLINESSWEFGKKNIKL